MKKIIFVLLLICLTAISKCYCSSYSNANQMAVNEPNLLKNGDFSDSLKNWLLIGPGVNPYHPTDPGRADFKVENGVLEVKIKNSGISIYSVMIYQPVTLKKDSTYTASFYARSDSDIPIISNFTQDGTYTNFSGDREFKLTGTMTKYSYDFKMTRDLTVLFQFCLGYKGTGSIFFDSLTVNVKPQITGLEIKRHTESGIRIFPNPATDHFAIEAGGELITKVEILNIAGQLVDRKIANNRLVIIERDNLIKGACFCKAYTGSGCYVGKVIIKD
jgi:hypothetical protein